MSDIMNSACDVGLWLGMSLALGALVFLHVYFAYHGAARVWSYLKRVKITVKLRKTK